jgi:hypothetical protein
LTISLYYGRNSVMVRRALREKGGKLPMRKMVVAVPEDLLKALKMRAVQTDRTLRALVIEGMEHVLQKGGKREKN